jgi:hypothetical protein
MKWFSDIVIDLRDDVLEIQKLPTLVTELRQNDKVRSILLVLRQTESSRTSTASAHRAGSAPRRGNGSTPAISPCTTDLSTKPNSFVMRCGL